MSHNLCLVLVWRFDHCRVLYSAMQSWYCFDWTWSRASMPPGGIAGVRAVIFFVSAAASKKLKIKDSKHENIYSPLRHQSMKAWRDLSQKLSVTAMSRMTNFEWFRTAIWKKNSQETSQSNKGGITTPRWTVWPWEFEKNSRKEENKISEQLACWKSLLKILTLNGRTCRTSKYP